MSRAVRPGICLLTETYHPVVGGGETQARTLAQELVARGWRVGILTRRSDKRSPKRERVGGVEVSRVFPTGSQHLNKWALMVTTLPALIRSRRQYDLLLVSGFRILGIPAMLI